MNNIKHVGIYVKNLEAMTIFYNEALSLHIVVDKYRDSGSWLDELVGETAEITITKMVTEHGCETGIGDMVELIKLENHSQDIKNSLIFQAGTFHIGFGVNDIFETCEKIIKAGGTIVVEPFKRENERWLAFAKDIEGNWLELIQ